MISPYDTDARPGAKREEYWLGLQAAHHRDRRRRPALQLPPGQRGGPGRAREHGRGCARLVFRTWSLTWPPPMPMTDNQMTAVIHDDLAARNLAPGRHYTDSGYLSAARWSPSGPGTASR